MLFWFYVKLSIIRSLMISPRTGHARDLGSYSIHMTMLQRHQKMQHKLSALSVEFTYEHHTQPCVRTSTSLTVSRSGRKSLPRCWGVSTSPSATDQPTRREGEDDNMASGTARQQKTRQMAHLSTSTPRAYLVPCFVCAPQSCTLYPALMLPLVVDAVPGLLPEDTSEGRCADAAVDGAKCTLGRLESSATGVGGVGGGPEVDVDRNSTMVSPPSCSASPKDPTRISTTAYTP